jgi:hypothetical protein
MSNPNSLTDIGIWESAEKPHSDKRTYQDLALGLYYVSYDVRFGPSRTGQTCDDAMVHRDGEV